MHVAAFVISLISSIISLFQSLIAGGLGGIGAVLSEKDSDKFLSMVGFALLILIAALVALVGGGLAMARKRQARTVLGVSAGLCFLAFMIVYQTMGFNDAAIWGGLYTLAALLAHLDMKKWGGAERDSDLSGRSNRSCRHSSGIE